MELSTRKRSGNSRTFRNLQPTQIDYSRNSGVLRWRRSLLPVHKSRMCSPQKSNKHAGFRAYELPRRSHKITRIDLRIDQRKCLLARREHYANGTVRLIVLCDIYGCVRDSKLLGTSKLYFDHLLGIKARTSRTRKMKEEKMVKCRY